jgi:hypothetical protein
MFALAPLSMANVKSADGNSSFMAAISSSGFLAFLSSSSKTNKYLSVKLTADVASSGAPLLLCPGMTTAGFKSRMVFREFNHCARAPTSVYPV